jgi:hypothetical protein
MRTDVLFTYGEDKMMLGEQGKLLIERLEINLITSFLQFPN